MFSIRAGHVVTMLEAFEIRAHSLAAPRMILCDPRNLIPITAWPANRNHCVVKCAAPYCRCSRIKDAVSFSVPLGVWLFGVGVMFNEELPAEVRMFAGVRMERWNFCDFRRIPVARLQDKHAKAVLGQISSKRPAACSGADDDEIVLCWLLFQVKSRVSQWNEDT